MDEPLWKFVDDWPQVSGYLRQTLDADLIPVLALSELRRSLDFRRVIGFVGSGVSMSYGRLGWGELIEWMLPKAPARLKQWTVGGQKRIVVLSDRPDSRVSVTHDHMKKLATELQKAEGARSLDIQSGSYPAAFQFIEECALEVEFPAIGAAPPRESRVRRLLRALLCDDGGQAYVLFERLFNDLAEGAADIYKDAWKKGLMGMSDGCKPLEEHWTELHKFISTRVDEDKMLTRQSLAERDRAAWRKAFDVNGKCLDALADALGQNSLESRLCTDLRQALFGLGSASAKPGSQVLAPLHRFVIMALLRLDPQKASVAFWPDAPGGDAGPASANNRRALSIPAGRDPLLMLLNDFGLCRFATTNYDLDLERAVADLGYDKAGFDGSSRSSEAASAQDLSRTALGMTAHDMVFRHQQAADLLRFASSHGPDIQVVHLHGRVLTGEPLVVTEADYQAHYLQRTDVAEAASDAVGLALRSNTVLFVGSGMSEDDILRPLRQFVTERKSYADRSGVVLLPADGSLARQVQEVIALYGRYGVLTKHYGVGDAETNQQPLHQGQLRWLNLWLAACDHLSDPLNNWKEKFPALKNLRDGLLDRYMKAPAGWTDNIPVPKAINGVPLEKLLPAMGLGSSFEDLTEVKLLRAVGQGMARLLFSIPGAKYKFKPQTKWPEHIGINKKFVSKFPRVQVAGFDREGWSKRAKRIILTLLAILDGLRGALRALAMMLELGSQYIGWQDWKRARALPLLPRPVGAQRHDVEAASAKERVLHVFTRNRLALRVPEVSEESEPPVVPLSDRFMLRAPSHSFCRFEEALQKVRPVDSGSAAGGPRRMFVLLGRRGLGKGHFFEMMSEDERVANFVTASWPKRTPPKYAVACYVNLGLSLEFLSAFDRLSGVLVEMAATVFPGDHGIKGAFEAAFQSLQNNRLARLHAVLEIYGRNAKKARERVLIAFSAFGLFFDSRGVPKNAQLNRLIDTLVGPAAERVPIDVLMICHDEDLPACFKKGGLRLPIERNRDLDGWSGKRLGPMIHLVEGSADVRVRRELQQTVDLLDLDVGNASNVKPSLYLHVLRGARVCTTVSKYFPDVALVVALHALERKALIAFNPADVRSIQNTFVRAFGEVEKSAAGRPSDRADAPKLTLRLLACLVGIDDRSAIAGLADLDRNLPGLKAAISGELGAEVDGFTKKIRALLQGPSAVSAAADLIDARFVALHHAVRGNRYLLTIVCAAASERGWRGGRNSESWSFDSSAVARWLDEVELDASNHLRDDAVGRIIRKVLASYEQRHGTCEIPPAWGLDGGIFGVAQNDASKFAALDEAVQILLCGRHQRPDGSAVSAVLMSALLGSAAWRLQQRLLWHLAVMAIEVQSDVLAVAPLVEADCVLLIREVCEGVSVEPIPVESLRKRGVCRLLVDLMLDLLVHRCLVFRMEPVRVGPPDVVGLQRRGDGEPMRRRGNPTDADAMDVKGNSGWRFTIHRFLQRSILEQMRAPFVEFSRIDQFGLSLWVSQPDELPRPNRSAAHDIAGLVAAWIGFPQNPAALKRTSTFHWFLAQAQTAAKYLARKRKFNAADPWRIATLPARMLRAALGVLRATYSVGVVSRFHAFDDDGGGLSAPDEGYFKQHHLQVRWLLEQAKVLQSREKGLGNLQACLKSKSWKGPWGAAMEALSPFYADEIVWLNNECGLFCLVEGRLTNAAGMFRQALEAARQVEGRDPRGALWCRIHLNLAVVDIERGRIREADERLADIEGVADENPILRIMARGFRGLVQHLSGNLQQAQTTYEQVIEDLVRLGQLRSVAIFSRHLAELHRLQGQGAAFSAFQAIQQSIAAATKGGHEDIFHLAMLSRVRLAIAGVLPADVFERDDHAIQKDLDAIEHYGHVMGMPRLLADVAYARARYLLKLGETRHAARLAHQCLSLCGSNGLRLRHMAGMALLGRIYRARGMTQLAETMLAQANVAAREYHYGNLASCAAGAAIATMSGR